MNTLVYYIRLYEKKELHTCENSVFSLFMFTHASGMLQVVLSWKLVLHGWTQVHLAQVQFTTQSSYIMTWVRHN